MKKIFLYTLIGFVFTFNFNCKNPVDELKQIQLNYNSNLANPLIKLSFKTNSATVPVPANIRVNITGLDADKIYDINGKRDFIASNGIVELILDPNAKADNNSPLGFTVEATADDCAPVRQEILVFSTKLKFTQNIEFQHVSNLPSGVKVETKELSFLGKKPIDTVSFDVTSSYYDVKFTVKYPTEGLTFVRKKNVKFKIGEQVRLVEEFKDSAFVTIDTVKKEIREVIGVQLYKDQIAEEYRVTGYTMTPTVNSHVEKVFVGYRIKDTVPVYENRIIFDTIPLSNVSASIWCRKDYLEYNFYDENNNLVEKPKFYQGVGFPHVYLYDKTVTNYEDREVLALYKNPNSGKIIECELPDKNWNLFFSGTIPRQSSENYWYVKKGIKLDKEANFIALPNGKFQYTIIDNSIDGELFLYKNSIVSCGYAIVSASAPKVAQNKGFNVNIFVNNSFESRWWSLTDEDAQWYRETYGTDPYVMSLAFDGYPSVFDISVDHYDNICKGNPPLYIDKFTIQNMCQYTKNAFKFTIPYDCTPYLASLPPFVPVNLNASILCSGGNYIIPPDIELYYRKINGCDNINYSSIKLINGQIHTQAFQAGQTYQIRYDRISSLGNPLEIYDTITFDTRPTQTIRDNQTGYWTGEMNYNGKQYDINFVFDNRKLRYDIKGCGK